MTDRSYPCPWSKFQALSVWMLVCIGLLGHVPGCASYRITTPGTDCLETHYHKVHMNAFFWGTMMSPLVVTTTECKGGICEIYIDDNLGYDLISVVTLGIWKPMTVRYRCQAPGAAGGAVVFPK